MTNRYGRLFRPVHGRFAVRLWYAAWALGAVTMALESPQTSASPPANGRVLRHAAYSAETASQIIRTAFENQKGTGVTRKSFGKTPEGIETHLFTITNAGGASLQLTDYGARIVAVNVPDRNGKLANVNLGFDSVDKYVAHTAYFGCTTGRFANRIAKGKFTLDGKEYKLAVNNGVNTLHGGLKGFDRQVWKAEEVSEKGSTGVKFTYRSPDGDEGYPGALDTTVTISLSDDNTVRIDYQATADKATVLNLTNHAYWNLSGAGSGPILKHKAKIEADAYLPVDDALIPTGKLAPVQGTFMDFTKPQEIGTRISETKFGDLPLGYDHCYILRDGKGGKLISAATVEDPSSGRVMEVLTTEPAIQFYTGNFLDGAAQNGSHKQHTAFCLETQHYPDSPNHPEFPTVVLRPGQTYKSTTVYRFTAK